MHNVASTTALNYWKQGVDGIYLVNWYASLWNEDRCREVLVAIRDPKQLSHRSKHYVVDRQTAGMCKRSHPEAQLPLSILAVQ